MEPRSYGYRGSGFRVIHTCVCTTKREDATQIGGCRRVEVGFRVQSCSCVGSRVSD